jgi:uncharacterized protein (DUF427 family)
MLPEPPEMIMPRATWNDMVIAEAADHEIEIVEGNVYFPADRVNHALLSASPTHTECGWKGTASYYDVCVGGQVNRDAAWYYSEPKSAAENIRGRIAFWRGVQVER